MDIFKIVNGLQSYSEGVVTFAFDSTFAGAVTAAAQLLVKQGERIVEMEEAAGLINTENSRLASENARLQLELEATRAERDLATKRVVELESQSEQQQQTKNIPEISEDDTRQKLYDILEDHCILQEYGECNNPKAPDCIWCLADALVKQEVTVKAGDEK